MLSEVQIDLAHFVGQGKLRIEYPLKHVGSLKTTVLVRLHDRKATDGYEVVVEERAETATYRGGKSNVSSHHLRKKQDRIDQQQASKSQTTDQCFSLSTSQMRSQTSLNQVVRELKDTFQA